MYVALTKQSATLWSALTCQGFSKRRLVAARLTVRASKLAATSRGFESGNKLPHSKYEPSQSIIR
jgi:hypothetical protein